jgi:uncharacterized repeat protein (TIGR03809 family)
MTHRLDVARGRDIVGRWCALAERRLDHLTELFETGRWRRYHSERAFLENIQEAKAAVELWRDLLMREDSRDYSVVDVSWLGRARAARARGEMLPQQARRFQPQPAPIPVEPPPSVVSVRVEAVHVSSEPAPSAPESTAFSAESLLRTRSGVDTGSRQENASNKELEPVFQSHRNGKGSSAAALDATPEPKPNIATMHERYPLLRNAM